MSLQLVADIWRELLDRCDSDSLLRELYGQSEIYSTSASHTLSEIYTSSRQLLIRLQVLFDLQRTYLQRRIDQPWDPKIDSYLVDSELHYTIILRIINLGANIPFYQGVGLSDYQFQRMLVIQTLLSSIRAYLLRNSTLSSSQILELQSRLEELTQEWTSRTRRPISIVEKFMLEELFPQTFNALGEPVLRVKLKQPACGNFSLPDYASGLYPFKIHYALDSEQHVQSAIRMTVGELDQGMLVEAYWTLCDVVWAAHAATIKCYAEQSNSQESSNTHSAMNQVISTVFRDDSRPANSSYRAPALKSLSESMASYGAASFSAQNEPYNAAQSNNYDSSTGSQALRSARQSSEWFKNELEVELRAFQRFLIQRKSQLRNCNGRPVSSDKDLPVRIQEWYRSTTGDATASGINGQSGGRSCVPLYLIDCRKLHPISKEVFEGLLGAQDKARFQIHQGRPEPFEVTSPVNCPYCDVRYPIRVARLVQPLSQTSHIPKPRKPSVGTVTMKPTPQSPPPLGNGNRRIDFIEHTASAPELVLGATQTIGPGKPENYPDRLAPSPNLPSREHSNASNSSSNPRSPVYSDRSSILGPVPETPLSPASPGSTVPTRGSSQATKSSWKRGQSILSSGWKRNSTSPTKTKTPLDSTLAFCFAASGMSLILWNKKNSPSLVKIDVPFQEGKKYSLLSGRQTPSTGVDAKLVAAGRSNIAVLAQYKGEGQKLIVFDEQGSRHEAAGNTLLEQKKCFSLAISPDGSLIALGFGTSVQVYKFMNWTIDLIDTVQIHTRPTGAAVNYQIANFSPDSKMLVAATQEDFGVHEDGIYLRGWACDAEKVDSRWRADPFRVTKGYTDDTGLTSVFFDGSIGKAFLGANLSKDYYSSISMGRDRSVLGGMRENNIDAAAQGPSGPSGSHFVFKNGKNNKLFTFDLSSGQVKPLADLQSDRKGVREELMALAMPQENLVYAVWRKEAKLVLKKIKPGGSKRTEMSEEDLRDVYDSCMAMA